MNYSTNISNIIPGKKYSDFSFDLWPLQSSASLSLSSHLSKPIKLLRRKRQQGGVLLLDKLACWDSPETETKRGRVLRAPEIRFIAFVYGVALRISNSPTELPLKLAVKPRGGRGWRRRANSFVPSSWPSRTPRGRFGVFGFVPHANGDVFRELKVRLMLSTEWAR